MRIPIIVGGTTCSSVLLTVSLLSFDFTMWVVSVGVAMATVMFAASTAHQQMEQEKARAAIDDLVSTLEEQYREQIAKLTKERDDLEKCYKQLEDAYDDVDSELTEVLEQNNRLEDKFKKLREEREESV